MNLEAKRQLGVPVDDPVEPQVEETVVEPEVVEPEVMTGHATTSLNVREEPVVDPDNILGVIKTGAEVMIYENESVGDFYKVCTEKGLEGFCMKQFIQVEP